MCAQCSDLSQSFMQFRSNCINSYHALKKLKLDNDSNFFQRSLIENVKVECNLEEMLVATKVNDIEQTEKTKVKQQMKRTRKIKMKLKKKYPIEDMECPSPIHSDGACEMDNVSNHSNESMEWKPVQQPQIYRRKQRRIKLNAEDSLLLQMNAPIAEFPKKEPSKPGRKRIPDHLKKKQVINRTLQICPICGESRKNIGTHIKTHSTDRPFDCSFCDLKFKTLVNLKRHTASHTNTRSYKCTIEGCERTFINYTSLALHKIQHTGEKNFACNICERRFVLPTTLKHHLKTHVQERRYECTVCDKKFLTGTDFRQHYRIHTGEKPYRCKFCDQKYRTAGMVRLHVKKYHAELMINYTEKLYHVDL